MPAFLNCQRELQVYNRLMNNTEDAVKMLYSYPLLEGSPKIINYEEIKNFNFKSDIESIAAYWEGIPLKGTAQDEFVNDFMERGVMDKYRRPIDNFKKAINICKEFGISFSDKKATKKDLEQWPQYLAKPREEYKMIIH